MSQPDWLSYKNQWRLSFGSGRLFAGKIFQSVPEEVIHEECIDITPPSPPKHLGQTFGSGSLACLQRGGISPKPGGQT
ncbi:MAG TPA: hypothetical protein VFX90_03365, partial [Rhodoferax sp.]|nr:hypothetical protein [Rhodoferax sp.]